MLNFGILFFNLYESVYFRMSKLFIKIDQLCSLAFTPAYYIFFNGYYTPYMYSRTNPWASGSAEPTILYNYDTNVFFPYTVYHSMFDTNLMATAKHIPILSLDIIDSNDKVQYDLTDFIETMRYIQYDDSGLPTLAQIVAAWSLSSHIVLDYSRFSIRYINQYGDTIKALLDDASDINQLFGDGDETESEESEEIAAGMEEVQDLPEPVLTPLEPEVPMPVKCKCHSWPSDCVREALDEFNKAWPQCESRVEQTLPTIRGILASESATGAPTEETTMVETPTVEGSAHGVEGSAHGVEGTSVEGTAHDVEGTSVEGSAHDVEGTSVEGTSG